jgi:hypothetical protein
MPYDDGWRPLRPDMPREQERRYLVRLRAMQSWEKFAEVSRLSEIERIRIEQRIRALRPTASPDEVRLYWFAQAYGRDLAMEAFGWDPVRKGW